MFGASGDTKSEMMDGLKYPESLFHEEIGNNFTAFSESMDKTEEISFGEYVIKI